VQLPPGPHFSPTAAQLLPHVPQSVSPLRGKPSGQLQLLGVLGVDGGAQTSPEKQAVLHAWQSGLVPSSFPSLQRQWPPWQVSPLLQAFPQAPQLLLSVAVSAHALPHWVVLAGQLQLQLVVLHCIPPVQSALLAHAGAGCPVGHPLLLPLLLPLLPPLEVPVHEVEQLL